MSKGISRYGEMRRAIPNISEKVLAYELRKLQSLGLIVKEVDKRERITMTEYKLTERGFGVIPLLEHMESWAKADRESEIAARSGSKPISWAYGPADESRRITGIDVGVVEAGL
jgi:DNA-binding HxlR family transcriptional regulator